ncbi:hypothetical protein H4R20_003876 [Coemansia guatemalensis]|uniref:Carbohydrate-binding module family 19 domain-containing protein n=1 Tax=Coemansia guatemalensis TaxID=2761395 RepID=A0A9W8HUE7_9FUNG|nr:hypothetical protein H4R20_003876 [Coemansia guatemalensis]
MLYRAQATLGLILAMATLALCSPANAEDAALAVGAPCKNEGSIACSSPEGISPIFKTCVNGVVVERSCPAGTVCFGKVGEIYCDYTPSMTIN